MRRNFELPFAATLKAGPGAGLSFWLLAAGGVLLAANLIAILLTVFPPGGSDTELVAQRDQLESQIRRARLDMRRLRNVSGKVETGSREVSEFETQYFLPERLAYSAVIAEIQRMAKAAGVQEREAAYSKEPIEGSDDLSLLNAGARFEGSYQNLMQFLNETDKSPMLLMVDTVRATPEQRSGVIDAEIRFQAVIHEEQIPMTPVGGQP